MDFRNDESLQYARLTRADVTLLKHARRLRSLFHSAYGLKYTRLYPVHSLPENPLGLVPAMAFQLLADAHAMGLLMDICATSGRRFAFMRRPGTDLPFLRRATLRAQDPGAVIALMRRLSRSAQVARDREERALALAMAGHPRLGAACSALSAALRSLPHELVVACLS